MTAHRTSPPASWTEGDAKNPAGNRTQPSVPLSGVPFQTSWTGGPVMRVGVNDGTTRAALHLSVAGLASA